MPDIECLKLLKMYMRINGISLDYQMKQNI